MKLFVSLAYIVLLMSLDKYNLAGVLLMVVPPLIVYTINRFSIGKFVYKLRFVLPLVFFVGVFNPFFDKNVIATIGNVEVTGGVISFITLLLKGTLALMASYALMQLAGIDEICKTLRKIHVPNIIVTTIMLAYRYIPMFSEQVRIMKECYELRSPGQKGIHFSAWGSFFGQLLLRSFDRAKELTDEMKLRGFDEI